MTTHLIGIGGAGMSAIARVLAAQGQPVSGCDRADGPVLAALRGGGVRCLTPHDPAHLAGVDEVVVSSAIAADEPELVRAQELGLPVRHRSEALAGILAAHARRVVVAGAHGKTTTSAMLAVALDRLGRRPTFLVGGEVRQLGTNAAAGDGGVCVVEGDESDGSVERLPADIGVVLNADLDHLDHYASRDEVVAVLARFAGSLPANGRLVLGDGVELDRVVAPIARFGVGPGEGLRALDVEAGPGAVRFRPSRGPERVVLGVGGVHNAGNACAAALALEALDVPLPAGFAALEAFTGAGRRFEHVGDRAGARVFDDYAHHPAELAATVATARALGGRLVVYFQPHMPWRTRSFAAGFAAALAAADVAVISDTYVARGRPDADASGLRIVRLLTERRPGMPVAWAPTYDAAVAILRRLLRAGDVVVCCGAGPVDDVARALVR